MIETEASCSCIRSTRTARSSKTNGSRGVLIHCSFPRRAWGLSQLKNINSRKSGGRCIQVKPAALFEDLSLFDTEGWFQERDKRESASLKCLGYLLKRPSVPLNAGV